jgi:cytochrome c5
MKTKFIIGLFALAFAYACTAKKAVVPNTEVKEAIVGQPFTPKLAITAETLAEGKSLYGMNCAKCHELFDPKSFNAEEWKPIVLRMQPKARISDEQREKIYAYLTTPQI